MNFRSIHFKLTIWYVGLLTSLLILFSISVYIGLERYMKWTLKESLIKQAEQIGQTLIINVKQSGEAYVVDEINEHFAPEINSRFISVLRADGSMLYICGLPKDKSFDPGKTPTLTNKIIQANFREDYSSTKEGLVIYALPFTSRDGSQFLIQTGASYQQINLVLHGLLITLFLGFPVAITIAIAGGYFLTRQALRQVDKITQSAEQITSRNLSERLPVTNSGDELERLSISLNNMISRLDESFQHTSRFTADASHELRTPLTILRGELEAIVQEPELSSEIRESISTSLEETVRLAKIVENLLAISRLDAGEAQIEKVCFDFAELVATTSEHMKLLAEDKQITLSYNVNKAKKIEVCGDRAKIKQVVVNLLDNAIKYTLEGGKVDLNVTTKNSSAILEVSDNGIGIPKNALVHIFERFYRVDKARSRQMGGCGLGLSIVKSICLAHGGQINVESKEGKGSLFQVELPLAKLI